MSRTVTLLSLLAVAAVAQPRPGQEGDTLASLRHAVVPKTTGLEQYVRDEGALIVLGKALFWDMQAGSDGRTACATCHFHAGADHRLQNQLASPHEGTATVVPNQKLTLADFPFRLFANTANNSSAVRRDSRYVMGSAGVFRFNFLDAVAGNPFDDGLAVTPVPGVFEIGGVNARQVTARNTPSVINSVFNVRNFWDGRARNVFTGSTPFGDSDQNWNVWIENESVLNTEPMRLENASLASQAVGPALNGIEMSYEGRSWPKLGRKMLSLQPLGRQKVETDDSVLGAFAVQDGNGLAISYVDLVQAAFQPRYWESGAANDEGFSQMELNFPIYWGLAIQAYEATLVSGETRYDKFMDGDRTALNALEQQGLTNFRAGDSQCSTCHMGPELTAASFTNVIRRSSIANPNLPDSLGFFRLGVSAVADDLGGAGNDTFGLPLFGDVEHDLTKGVFKAPGLRNVELTGPYFHNGGQATIEQVLLFYSRKGDFPDDGNLKDTFNRINMSAFDQVPIAAFLRALTDDRVKFERAPFDHPSLCVPTGHEETAPGELKVSSEGTGLTAVDKWALIPGVGKSGNSVALQTFQELLQGTGNNGSRAHTLTQSCTP